jgi:glucuronosyltransferase
MRLPLHALPLVALILFSMSGLTSGDSYLVLHPPCTASHIGSIFAITKELVKQGHTVTTVRYELIQGTVLPSIGLNHTEFVLSINNTEGNIPYVSKGENGMFIFDQMLDWKYALNLMENFVRMPSNPWAYYSAYCDSFLGNHDLVSHLRSMHFDVAIVDLVQHECALALVVDMGVPVVGFWLTTPIGLEMEATTQPSNPTYVPFFMSGFTDKMGFWQRLINTCLKINNFLLLTLHFWNADDSIRRHIPHSPSSSEMLGNLSGCLINSHSIYQVPMPRVPTFVNILGNMMDKVVQPLPHEIADFIAGAEHGVILFTMGMTYAPSDIPEWKEKEIIEVFSRLKQRVLMKLSGIPHHLPSNIMVKKFLPQQSILANAKTVLFFTHVGNNGLLEAIYNRVPMIGLPIYLNQQDNLNRLIEMGVAEGVDKKSSVEDMYQAVIKVLGNDRYKKNIDKLADLLALERADPMEDALWLLDYVSKTKGAEHLKIASRNLNFVQYMGLDLLAFSLLALYACWKVVCFVYKQRPRQLGWKLKDE